jgi:hypothetical protein
LEGVESPEGQAQEGQQITEFPLIPVEEPKEEAKVEESN